MAVEEPLEIRVGQQALAVLMRTPGDDLALAAGFLLTEGVIDGADDLVALTPCRDPAAANPHNVVLASLAEGCDPDGTSLSTARRRFFTGASCGLCGKATVDAVLQAVRPFDTPLPLDRALIAAAGGRARAVQRLFDVTGGLHGAALFDATGAHALLAHAEDIGRHNAVDKVIGRLLLDERIPLGPTALWVSGRLGFDLVQKAALAGIRALIGVGAPTSLAVSLAREARLSLVGFAQGPERFNVYVGEVIGAGAGA